MNSYNNLRSFPGIALRIISHMISARALEMADFSLRQCLAIAVNRYFLESECDDLYSFSSLLFLN